MSLSVEQSASWNNDGYVVLPGFVSTGQTAALTDRIGELVDAFAHSPGEANTVFSTTEQTHAQDEYFLTSGDVIRPFFEDGAFDAGGNLQVPMDRALNKLGHAMHDLDPVFDRFSRTPELATLAADLGFVDPLLLQSMVIFKPPHIGGEVICHCDHSFLWTEPQTVAGFWFALDDATVDNGCLWVTPGGHRQPARTRFRIDGAGTTTDVIDPVPYEMDGLVPVEVEAGTLIAFSGLLPHWSAPNTSDRSRLAYTLHMIDGTADYLEDNWLQRGPDLPLRGFG
ncbi:MAG: hypothetical protein MAG471_00749 [Acidimicrobiaceae bacterium]|nr:hypothetical protein [Acidimicrobiaceae bacterium]